MREGNNGQKNWQIGTEVLFKARALCQLHQTLGCALPPVSMDKPRPMRQAHDARRGSFTCGVFFVRKSSQQKFTQLRFDDAGSRVSIFSYYKGRVPLTCPRLVLSLNHHLFFYHHS